jgi:hypothetical protein
MLGKCLLMVHLRDGSVFPYGYLVDLGNQNERESQDVVSPLPRDYLASCSGVSLNMSYRVILSLSSLLFIVSFHISPIISISASLPAIGGRVLLTNK